MIKYVEADNELAALVESFGVRADRWCFFLLNDSTDPNVPCAGSHWILVVYDPLKKSVGVLDSMSSVVDEGTRQEVPIATWYMSSSHFMSSSYDA